MENIHKDMARIEETVNLISGFSTSEIYEKVEWERPLGEFEWQEIVKFALTFSELWEDSQAGILNPEVKPGTVYISNNCVGIRGYVGKSSSSIDETNSGFAGCEGLGWLGFKEEDVSQLFFQSGHSMCAIEFTKNADGKWDSMYYQRGDRLSSYVLYFKGTDFSFE